MGVQTLNFPLLRHRKVGMQLIRNCTPCALGSCPPFPPVYRKHANTGRSRLMAVPYRFQAKTHFLCGDLRTQKNIFE